MGFISIQKDKNKISGAYRKKQRVFIRILRTDSKDITCYKLFGILEEQEIKR